MRNQIRDEVAAIQPLDDLEREHITEALAWIDSGAELCRLAKPATPAMHLVSYAVIVDDDNVLLVDHRNARLWLPTGGHVEPGEHPRTTAVREIREELGLAAELPIEPPLMITSTVTVGLAAGHTDISLWYVLRADRRQPVRFDPVEFISAQWFALHEVPFERSDPHMRRFIAKLGTTDCTKWPRAVGGTHR